MNQAKQPRKKSCIGEFFMGLLAKAFLSVIAIPLVILFFAFLLARLLLNQ